MAGSTPEIDAGTITSLLAALGLFVSAVLLSFGLLPAGASPRSRVLFVWHAFDALIHAAFEGSFLYHCFASYVQLVAPPSHVSRAHLVLTPPGVHFLAQPTRLYGSAYAAGPTARLWQEYAKADRRWGGVDLTVVSLEMLTVLLGAPIAAWIVYLLARGHGDVAAAAKGRGKRMSGKLSFWLIVLATAELYGGAWHASLAALQLTG